MSYLLANRTESQAQSIDEGRPVDGITPADFARQHAQTVRELRRIHGRETFDRWARARDFSNAEWSRVRDAIRPLWSAAPGDWCAADCLRVLAFAEVPPAGGAA